MTTDRNTTHFGFREVPEEAKAEMISRVFRSVSDKYDLMNDLMSLGLHRIWKHFTVLQSSVRRGQSVLDLAGGTGDMTARFARRVGPSGQVVLADINEAMLARGRERLTDEGLVGNIHYVKADAEALPFREQYFDCVCISFGLRNVTRIDKALQSMFRALKPGGQVLILEFSHVTLPMLEKVYDLYSFSVLPRLGRWVTGDEDSYRYLVESIRKHPPQDKLQQMMEQEGFDRVRCFNLSGGIAAVHRGNKF